MKDNIYMNEAIHYKAINPPSKRDRPLLSSLDLAYKSDNNT